MVEVNERLYVDANYFFNEKAAIVMPPTGTAMKNMIFPKPIDLFINWYFIELKI